jgi:hypothetical protein
LLRDLGDVAIPIPWDDQRRALWQKRFDDERVEERRSARGQVTGMVSQDASAARDPQYKDLPYGITRQILQDYFNADADDRLLRKIKLIRKVRPGSSVEAVAAYPTFNAIASDVVVAEEAVQAAESGQFLSPTIVFGWQFFVPDSAESGEDEDRRLLARIMREG